VPVNRDCFHHLDLLHLEHVEMVFKAELGSGGRGHVAGGWRLQRLVGQVEQRWRKLNPVGRQRVSVTRRHHHQRRRKIEVQQR